MKRFKILVVMLGIFVVGIGWTMSSGWAQQPKNVLPQRLSIEPERRPDESVQPVVERDRGDDLSAFRIDWRKLNLTPEQRDQMMQKRREFEMTTSGLRQELKFAEDDLRVEIEKEAVDQTKIDALLQTIASLKQRINETATQNLLGIRGLLTPEQISKFAELQAPLPEELQGLQLTPEQRSQIQTIFKQVMTQNRKIVGDVRLMKEDLRDMFLASEPVDAAKIQQLQKTITDQEIALERARIDLTLQIKAVLTPEQRQQLQRLRDIQEKRERIEPAIKNPRVPKTPKQ